MRAVLATIFLLTILGNTIQAQFPNQEEGQRPAQMFQIEWQDGGKKLLVKVLGETKMAWDSKQGENAWTFYWVKNKKKEKAQWSIESGGLSLTPAPWTWPYELHVEGTEPDGKKTHKIPVPKPH